MRPVAHYGNSVVLRSCGRRGRSSSTGCECDPRRRIRRNSRPPGVGVPVVIDGAIYDRVPARVLFITGPRYTEPSGVRIGRGSVIPDWLAAARCGMSQSVGSGLAASTATLCRRITRWSFSSLARAGSRASSAEPGKDHPLDLGEESTARNEATCLPGEPPRYGCPVRGPKNFVQVRLPFEHLGDTCPSAGPR